MQPVQPVALPLFIHARGYFAATLARLAKALNATPEEAASVALAAVLPSLTEKRGEVLPMLRAASRGASRCARCDASGTSCPLFFVAVDGTADTVGRLAKGWNVTPAAVAEAALRLTVEDLADPLCDCCRVLQAGLAKQRAAVLSFSN